MTVTTAPTSCLLAYLLLCLLLISGKAAGFLHCGGSYSCCSRLALTRKYDGEDDERLLLTPPAVAAYVQAEVRIWLLESVGNEELEEAATEVAKHAKDAYLEAKRQDILSHHGALISFVSTEL